MALYSDCRVKTWAQVASFRGLNEKIRQAAVGE
jgi:hypothetical protein